MISYLRGTVQQINTDSILVVTNGIGYEVRHVQTGASLKKDDEVALYIQTFIRDDHFELYGLNSAIEQSMFRQLTDISGVGPKMALGILSKHSIEDIHRAVLENNTEVFTAVPGIGKKNASRIVLELRSKIGQDTDVAALEGQSESRKELVQAMKGLGYQPAEIGDMIKNIPSDLSLEEQIRQALKKKA